MIDPSTLKPLVISALQPPMNIVLVTPESGLEELSSFVAEKLRTRGLLALAWAAGLFEGEGSFDVRRNNVKGVWYSYIRLQIDSTDEDVLQRFLDVVACGKVYGPYEDRRKNRLGDKPYWKYTVSGKPAISLALKLKPFLCKRRTQKLECILSSRVKWGRECQS